MIQRARRRLAALPTWGQALLAALVALLIVPWALRAYMAYWDIALGRPGHAIEMFLPTAR